MQRCLRRISFHGMPFQVSFHGSAHLPPNVLRVFVSAKSPLKKGVLDSVEHHSVLDSNICVQQKDGAGIEAESAALCDDLRLHRVTPLLPVHGGTAWSLGVCTGQLAGFRGRSAVASILKCRAGQSQSRRATGIRTCRAELDEFWQLFSTPAKSDDQATNAHINPMLHQVFENPATLAFQGENPLALAGETSGPAVPKKQAL